MAEVEVGGDAHRPLGTQREGALESGGDGVVTEAQEPRVLDEVHSEERREQGAERARTPRERGGRQGERILSGYWPTQAR